MILTTQFCRAQEADEAKSNSLHNFGLDKRGFWFPKRMPSPPPASKEDYEVFRLKKRQIPSTQEIREVWFEHGPRLEQSDAEGFRLKKKSEEGFRLKKSEEGFRLKKNDEGFRLKKNENNPLDDLMVIIDYLNTIIVQYTNIDRVRLKTPIKNFK